MKIALTLGFLLTAAIYASVGFGGGSTYTALLAVSGASFTLIPIISLLCNICVVSGNSWRYLRRKTVKLSQVWPLFILSIPAALLGGRLHVSELLFISLLSLALFIAGTRMVFTKRYADNQVQALSARTSKLGVLIGGAIGFYSGIVGIGGGIFLAPILYRLRWGGAQQIAATCSLFILVNSVAGLVGQLSKSAGASHHAEILSYWPLIIAVLIGGTLGNMLSFHMLRPEQLRRITGILILIVAVRLALKALAMATFI